MAEQINQGGLAHSTDESSAALATPVKPYKIPPSVFHASNAPPIPASVDYTPPWTAEEVRYQLLLSDKEIGDAIVRGYLVPFGTHVGTPRDITQPKTQEGNGVTWVEPTE